MDTLPSIFVSHGAPSLVSDDCPSHDFLKKLGEKYPKPKAILVISAHFPARRPTITAALAPKTLYDFSGFSPSLYNIRYPAPGDPALAEKIAFHLKNNDYDVALDPERGFDHATWVPLYLMYPKARIPVLQLSITPGKDSTWHFEMGKHLSYLRKEGVLVVGSGGITHNLRAFFKDPKPLDAPPPDWVSTFADWVSDKITSGAQEDILDAVEKGPQGKDNHPTLEHILPLFVAMGAGHPALKGKALHRSYTYGVLAMDVYAFAE